MLAPFSPVEIGFYDSDKAIERLSDLVSCKDNILLLASERRINECGLADFLHDIKKSKNLVHLSRIASNPSIRDVYECLKLLNGTNPDVIIALGGGSCIDLAKAIVALYGIIPDDELSKQSVRSAIKNKDYLSKHEHADIIALPTTSGTGSEVTKWATVWDMDHKEKLSIDSPNLFPKAALLVPEFTFSMPLRLTLATGLDALSHAMEAFWARSRNPLSQALAISAIEHIKEYLPKVMRDGRNLHFRQGMSLASLVAGLAFSITRTTACHSISYPLTLLFGVEHGFATALTLLQVAERNRAVVPEIDRIYSVFGSKEGFSKWVKDITQPVLELRLATFGIKETDLDAILDKTFTQGRMDNNPISFTPEEVRDILHNVL